MFSIFKIYRNHKRFLLLQKMALDDLNNLLSRIETRNNLIDRGDNVEENKRIIQNYKLSAIQTYFIFEPLFFDVVPPLDTTKLSALLLIRKIIIYIKDL
ncbi:MAG: hypothetical protein PHE73_03800 [Sulfurovaceae bacterium]|nr:hypothetical protein [Sulfurovaceae bacterium]